MSENQINEGKNEINFKRKLFGGFKKNEVTLYIKNLEKSDKENIEKMQERIKELSKIINKLISERVSLLEKLSNANKMIGRNMELLSKVESDYSFLTEEVNNLINQLHTERENKVQNFNNYIQKRKGELTFKSLRS